nr:spidroin-1-like isoform X1 [Helicoverpa armigera]XP_049706159.1 spidroin-1-like isoform X1 [Helicoverpa armigera]XP_049706160.1 spidroin-1-like isoform X1 [Helicoverpa armigera]
MYRIWLSRADTPQHPPPRPTLPHPAPLSRGSASRITAAEQTCRSLPPASMQDASDPRGGAIAFALIYFTFFLDNVLLTVLVPIIPDWVRGSSLALWRGQGAPLASVLNHTVAAAEGEAGGAQALLGAVLGAKAAAQLLTAPLAGAAVCRRGAAPVLRAGTAALAAAAGVFAGVSGRRGWRAALAVALGRAAHGAGAALAGVAGLALAARALPPHQRDRAIGALLGAVALGVLVGYACGGAAAALWSRAAPFTLLAGALLANLGLQYMFLNKDEYNSVRSFATRCICMSKTRGVVVTRWCAGVRGRRQRVVARRGGAGAARRGGRVRGRRAAHHVRHGGAGALPAAVAGAQVPPAALGGGRGVRARQRRLPAGRQPAGRRGAAAGRRARGAGGPAGGGSGGAGRASRHLRARAGAAARGAGRGAGRGGRGAGAGAAGAARPARAARRRAAAGGRQRRVRAGPAAGRRGGVVRGLRGRHARAGRAQPAVRVRAVPRAAPTPALAAVGRRRAGRRQRRGGHAARDAAVDAAGTTHLYCYHHDATRSLIAFNLHNNKCTSFDYI